MSRCPAMLLMSSCIWEKNNIISPFFLKKTIYCYLFHLFDERLQIPVVLPLGKVQLLAVAIVLLKIIYCKIKNISLQNCCILPLIAWTFPPASPVAAAVSEAASCHCHRRRWPRGSHRFGRPITQFYNWLRQFYFNFFTWPGSRPPPPPPPTPLAFALLSLTLTSPPRPPPPPPLPCCCWSLPPPPPFFFCCLFLEAYFW